MRGVAAQRRLVSFGAGHYLVFEQTGSSSSFGPLSATNHTARPISLGRRNQVWEVRIVDGDDKLVCISRCAMAVIDAA